MTQLEKLYQSIQNLQDLGVQLPEKLIEETNRIEEEIIKDDIIPALADSITPIINQIQRELLLVVEYIPDKPLTVKLTKKRSLTIPPELDTTGSKNKSESTHRQSYTISAHTKSGKTNLRVIFPDGTTISHRYAYDTLVDTIRKIGFEKVRALNMQCCGVPLVSNSRDAVYAQHEVANGVFVMTHSSTRSKKEQLDEISNRLALGLKIMIV